MAIGKLGIVHAATGLACCLALLICCASRPAAAQSIGKATAVKNQVQGVRGGSTRSLSAGGSVFSDDTVRSGANSLAQLLFLDQTTFTVGANSQAVLSSVYRGNRGVAAKVMRAVAGAFRFVSGVEAPSKYQIQFPQGYITVRGTIVDVLAGADHSLIIDDEGAITVHVYATGANYDLDAGQMLVVYSNGRADGPMTIDASIIQINGEIPFPLFGSAIWPTQQQSQGLRSYESNKDRNDILNTTRGGGGGNGGCPAGTILIIVNGRPFCSAVAG
jgi:hypothetical protein